MALKSQPLVSIIVPVYNAERFIEETIASVQAQTYENWELILVDDKSTDDSLTIMKNLQKYDKRIRLFSNRVNVGVAKSRNAGLDAASGSFLAYLDADDIWTRDKLTSQLDFMLTNNYVFTFTGYNFIDSLGVKTGVVAKVPERVSFYGYLKNNIIWTTTVIFDLDAISKSHLRMEDISYGEDAKLWLSVLDRYGDAFGINTVLASYRRGGVTLSSNKIKAVTKKFALYMSIENINSVQALYYFFASVAAAIRKRF